MARWQVINEMPGQALIMLQGQEGHLVFGVSSRWFQHNAQANCLLLTMTRLVLMNLKPSFGQGENDRYCRNRRPECLPLKSCLQQIDTFASSLFKEVVHSTPIIRWNFANDLRPSIMIPWRRLLFSWMMARKLLIPCFAMEQVSQLFQVPQFLCSSWTSVRSHLSLSLIPALDSQFHQTLGWPWSGTTHILLSTLGRRVVLDYPHVKKFYQLSLFKVAVQFNDVSKTDGHHHAVGALYFTTACSLTPSSSGLAYRNCSENTLTLIPTFIHSSQKSKSRNIFTRTKPLLMSNMNERQENWKGPIVVAKIIALLVVLKYILICSKKCLVAAKDCFSASSSSRTPDIV